MGNAKTSQVPDGTDVSYGKKFSSTTSFRAYLLWNFLNCFKIPSAEGAKLHYEPFVCRRAEFSSSLWITTWKLQGYVPWRFRSPCAHLVDPWRHLGFCRVIQCWLDVLEATETFYSCLFTLGEKIWRKVTGLGSFKVEGSSAELGDEPPTDGGGLRVRDVPYITRH